MVNKNAIEYWYPKIRGIVPTPRTIIVPAKRKWDKSGNYIYVPKKYVKEIVRQTENFIFPIFLRANDSSTKHDWKDTCFVPSKDVLEKHIQRIAYECECLDVFGGAPVSSFAIREYIEMDSKFSYFWGGLPINPERRYFINDHRVVCRHFYWTTESIKDKQYEALLNEMNKETEEEKKLLNKYACKIAKIFDGYWSIDFCRAKTGKWYCIDMAVGYNSWHPECGLKIKKGEQECL